MTFQELDREKKFRGHAFDVSIVHFRLPDGRERHYDLVEHGDSISILPVDEYGQIYFVSQYRIGAADQLLELPAGVLDAGEVPLQCAQRELREEIGMAAGHIQELGGFYLAPGYTSEYMTAFLATGLYHAPLEPDEDEFLNVVKMPMAEAYQKVLKGEIRDGKSLAALLLAMPHLTPQS
ncbi:MAG: NUDIX hydrolase [Anaerolineae bacterium]|jgi:ADP-ribose pyrophosphatase|nr:NUDIX hydrolase [Anaerolineae bacterium]